MKEPLHYPFQVSHIEERMNSTREVYVTCVKITPVKPVYAMWLKIAIVKYVTQTVAVETVGYKQF